MDKKIEHVEWYLSRIKKFRNKNPCRVEFNVIMAKWFLDGVLNDNNKVVTTKEGYW